MLSPPSPEKEQTPTYPACPCQGRFFNFLDDLGPGWDAGGTAFLREARRAGLGVDLACGGAEQLWRMQENAHGEEQTEACSRGQRWLTVHHSGAGCAGSPLCASAPRELLGKALDSVAEQPRLGDGVQRIARLSQRWRSWTTWNFVTRRAKSLAVRSSCIKGRNYPRASL